MYDRWLILQEKVNGVVAQHPSKDHEFAVRVKNMDLQGLCETYYLCQLCLVLNLGVTLITCLGCDRRGYWARLPLQ